MIEDAYFIDRDGKIFGEILNFLRNCEEYELPSNPDKLKRLLTEAEYYAMSPLIEKIQRYQELSSPKFFHIYMPAFYTKDYSAWVNCFFSTEKTPQVLQGYLDLCKCDRMCPSQIHIIETAEKEGFRLIQEYSCAQRDQYTRIHMLFQNNAK